jgi:hypothetical protein
MKMPKKRWKMFSLLLTMREFSRQLRHLEEKQLIHRLITKVEPTVVPKRRRKWRLI